MSWHQLEGCNMKSGARFPVIPAAGRKMLKFKYTLTVSHITQYCGHVLYSMTQITPHLQSAV